MKPIDDAETFPETQALATNAIAAYLIAHPLAEHALTNSVDFGDQSDRVRAVRAEALVRMVKRSDEFSQPWNTYADGIYAVQWDLDHRGSWTGLRDDQVEAVRAALKRVLASRAKRTRRSE
jgi:hypothetical protein